MRLKALRYAADVSYLDLGDYVGAIGYYRRIVSLYPGTEDAWNARAAIGDIYAQRLGDPRAAIAEYAAVAGGDAREAPRFQLLVARQYLELKNFEQARTEARMLRERWPQGPEADDAQLLTAQAWSLEDRPDEALGAFLAAVERRPRPEVARRSRWRAQRRSRPGPEGSTRPSSCTRRPCPATPTPMHSGPTSTRSGSGVRPRRP